VPCGVRMSIVVTRIGVCLLSYSLTYVASFLARVNEKL
jgi:hypothetical protein